MRLGFTVGVEVDPDNAAAVDKAADEFVRSLRGMDGVSDVFGTLSNDNGSARAVSEVLDTKAAKAAEKAEAKADAKTR